MLKTAFRSNKKGFTLVELLVVITIIAILATIGLTIYGGARKSARTAKRIQDLKAIQTALEVYYSVNKTYPVVYLGVDTGFRSECGWGNFPSDQVVPNPAGYPSFVPNYMPVFPSDPSMKKDTSQSCYIYRSNGTDYEILDHEIEEFTNKDYLQQKNLISPQRDGGTAPCNVEEDGARIWSWALFSSCVPSW